MPAVKMSFVPRAVGICPGDEVKRSDIQREIVVELLHFLSIEGSKATRVQAPDQYASRSAAFTCVLGTSAWTEGPWVRAGLARGSTNPVLPESA